ncbi:N-6 DNA methylase, partial [Candidatus Woesearchaeota archaeon]|nr:N-6 DNA methylase [Candidatus Woesearchaeota archaeon]
ERFKKYFGYLNTGFKGKQYDIFAYNGGLFKPDEVLANIVIDDELLYKHTLKLADYDFVSEVDVNILGHIFEQSISDIEDLKNQKESKRKKDGVYYTPEYITDYICRNTIIPYLSKKSINDIPKLISEYENDIEILEKKLEDIKILDPACGSGAFLIKAVEILLEIHKEIQMFKEGFGKYSASTQGKNQAQLILTKWSDENKSKEIILKNIYGVDINEESIEITKLSLFLKMARKNRKLTDLSNHVKQGNSLIDDETVDTETAFDWDKEFPFKFDIVIGNPPYVRVQNLTHAEIDWYKANKKTAFKRVDISIMFMELANTLLKPKGILGYITSNQFIVTEYGKNLRKFILDKYRIKKIIDFGALPIFYGASTYVSIFIFENNTKKNFKYIKINNMTEAQHITNVNEINIDISSLNDEAWKLINKNELILMNRLSLITNLKDIGNAWTGLITGMDEVLMFDESRIKELNFEKEAILPIIRGTDPKRYSYCRPSKYVIYPYTTNKDKTVVLSEADLKNKYPCVYNYLLQNKNVLINRKDSRKTFANRKDWYSLVRFGQKNVFNKFKIVSPGEVKNHKFAIDTSKAGFSCARVFAITLKNEDYDIKYVLTILNSKLIKFYLRQIAPLKQGGFYTYSSAILNKVPLMDLSRTQQKPFIQKADHMLKLNKELSELRNAFIKRLEGNYNLHKTTKKLEKFYELDENMFLKELQKITKTKLSLDQQDTLAKFFNKYKNKITEIRTKIGQIDKEIDPMVYNLYRLTPEEIKIVEKSLK